MSDAEFRIPFAALTIVGCRGGMPGDGWPSSCYLLDTGGQQLLFDCGPGAATALTNTIAPTALTAVFLSHRHLDHCLDLVVVGKQLLYADRGDPLPLYVPAGTGRVLGALNQLLPVGEHPELPFDNVFDAAFDVEEYEPGAPIRIGDVVVSPAAMRHRIPSYGFRVDDDDGTFCYSGDTGPTPELGDLAEAVDVLLAEATLQHPDTTGHGHLCAADAGQAAQRASAGALVLTHLTSADPAWIAAQRSAAADHFDGPIFVATPGARFPLRPPTPRP